MEKNVKRNIIVGVFGAVVITSIGVFFYNEYKKNNPRPINTPSSNSNSQGSTPITTNGGGIVNNNTNAAANNSGASSTSYCAPCVWTRISNWMGW